MKKKRDIGLEYISRFGINYERTHNAQEEKVLKALGKDLGQQIITDIHEILFNDKVDDWQAKYTKILASQPNLANIWQGSCDANYVRAACNYISSNKDCFGDNIIEVGCGFGFITCFLSQLFPDKQITSIDIDPSCVTVAKANAERLGCQNVNFIVGDLNSVSSKFDTVFISRVIHEVAGYTDCFNYNENPFLIMDYVANKLAPFTHSIVNCLEDDGSIISIDKTYRNPLYLAWIKSLSTVGYYLELNTHDFIEVPLTGISEDTGFMAGVYKKTNPQNVIDTYFSVCSKKLDFSLKTLNDDTAYLYFWNSNPELVKGITSKTKNQISDSTTVVFLLALTQKHNAYIEYLFSDAEAHVVILPCDSFSKEAALSSYENDYNKIFASSNKTMFYSISNLDSLNHMIF